MSIDCGVPYVVRTFPQDVGEEKIYNWDFTKWLAKTSDTITTQSIDIYGNADLTVGTATEFGGVVSAKISGVQEGKKYRVTCVIGTLGTRVSRRSIYIKHKPQ